MPGATRRLNRNNVRSTPISPPVISTFANELCGQRYAPLGASVPTLPALEPPAAPKHFPFPNTPMDNDFFFEAFMCFFAICTTALQFLHLYRSVWWLPNSYTRLAMVSFQCLLCYSFGHTIAQLVANYLLNNLRLIPIYEGNSFSKPYSRLK